MTDNKNIHEQLKQYSHFLSDYAIHLQALGVHTTRVIRNTCRIASAFGVNAEMTILHKTLNLTLSTHDGQHIYDKVSTIHPLPVSFRLNTRLSALSWLAYDEHLDLEEVWTRYHAILSEPRINDWLVLLLVGFANAAFLRVVRRGYMGLWFRGSCHMDRLHHQDPDGQKTSQYIRNLVLVCLYVFHDCFVVWFSPLGTNTRHSHCRQRIVSRPWSTSAQ